MERIIVDTNALFIPFQLKIRIEDELERLFGKVEIIVPESVINELYNLSKTNTIARAALKYAMKFRVVKNEGSGDRAIVNLAIKTGYPVLTNDKRLKRILKAHGIRVIETRGMKRLEVV